MGFIVSFNGTDGSGKTTQINNLKGYNIEVMKDISEYNVFPKLDEKKFFEWWFFKSTLSEFCVSVYTGIKIRQEEAINSDKKIVLYDKGINTFEARILANFLTRGYSNEEIRKEMLETKERLGLIDDENLKLLLLTEHDLNSRLKIAEQRRNLRIGNRYYTDYYNIYQNNLEGVLQQQIENNEYCIIPANDIIEEVSKRVKTIIASNYLTLYRKESEYER